MAECFTHIVTAQQQGQRLDALVASLDIEGLASRSAAVRLIESGRILVNGAASTKKRLVLEGDELSIEVPARSGEPATIVPAYNIPLDIRYEDEHIIVLSKQPGLVSHCGTGNLAEVQGEDRPGIVHRLDRDTSGLMLAAKTDLAAARLQDDIRLRTVDRRYCTLVHGNIARDTGMVDAPIGRDERDRTRMAVSANPLARSSITTFTVLERFEAGRQDDGYTLMECKLYTGRTHQIRVHMSYTGHPVVGDPVYGRAANVKARNRDAAQRMELGLGRQFLHSYRLSFEHPISGELLSFEDELPWDLCAVLDQLAERSEGRTDYGVQQLGED